MKRLTKHPLDEMTPIERAQAIQKNLPFDRMPVNLFMPDIKSRMIGCQVGDLYQDVDCMVQAEIEAYQRYGADWLFTGPNSKGIAVSLGASVVYPVNGLPRIKEYILTDYSDLDQIYPVRVEDSDRLGLFQEVVKRLSQAGSGVVNIGASLGGTLTIASYLRGTENLLRDMRKHPAQLHLLLGKVILAQKLVVDQFKKIPGITFAMADPLASGSLLSPKLFKEFALPYLQELSQYIVQETNTRPSLHMCGRVERFWPEIKSLDLATFSIDNASNMRQAIEFFGDKFPVTGNVPPVEVMYKAGKEEVYQAVRACIEAAKGNPRVGTLGVGCDIPLAAPLENIQHYMDAVRQFASYPVLKNQYGSQEGSGL